MGALEDGDGGQGTSYAREVCGQTPDPWFALMGPMAPALALAAAQVASRLGFKD